MKIAYSHLVRSIKEKPTIEEISNSLFQLGHEHEVDGGIFDMEFTPNRGDCLSVNGLLRDLAVFYTVNFNQDTFTEKLDELSMNFENLSDNICPQISFLKLSIDKIPEEYTGSLKTYFSDLGLNKNNFYTDVSNYISYETGQPTHCYDETKMIGKLVFHETDQEEEFETLLNKKITLSKKNAVFSLNNNIINLAGVVGGKNTSCSTNTNTVIVECAYFQPEAIIGKSVKYDIQSEASHKFERGVDPSCHDEVLRRFIKIVDEHATIKEMSITSYKFKDHPKYQISFDVNKINQIIGINISKGDYLSTLLKLGFSVEENFVQVPPFRSDIKTNNDLAEEIARVIGYNNIERQRIDIPNNEQPNLTSIENKLRFFLLDNGFYEVINSPFVKKDSEDAIRVDNPLDSGREYLRTNVTNSLINNLLFNEKRQKDSIKLFEISDIYSLNKGMHQNRRLSIIASGRVGLNYEDFSKKINKKYLRKLFQKIQPNKDLDFQIIPRDSLNTKVKNEIISLEIDISEISQDALSYSETSEAMGEFKKYKTISEQPSSFKDISYLIKDFTKVTELENLLLNYQNDIIKHAYIFDYFNNEKEGKIKIGFRFIFQSQKTTLTSAQIESVYNDILKKSGKIEGISIPGMTNSNEL